LPSIKSTGYLCVIEALLLNIKVKVKVKNRALKN